MKKIYICKKCNNVITKEIEGNGTLVCCDEEMVLLTPNTEDAAHEKHVPVINVNDEEIIVNVGEVSHPMEENHSIKWIRLENENETITKYLYPGEEPVCTFPYLKNTKVYAYCDKHGLWVSEVK